MAVKNPYLSDGIKGNAASMTSLKSDGIKGNYAAALAPPPAPTPPPTYTPAAGAPAVPAVPTVPVTAEPVQPSAIAPPTVAPKNDFSGVLTTMLGKPGTSPMDTGGMTFGEMPATTIDQSGWIGPSTPKPANTAPSSPTPAITDYSTMLSSIIDKGATSYGDDGMYAPTEPAIPAGGVDPHMLAWPGGATTQPHTPSTPIETPAPIPEPAPAAPTPLPTMPAAPTASPAPVSLLPPPPVETGAALPAGYNDPTTPALSQTIDSATGGVLENAGTPYGRTIAATLADIISRGGRTPQTDRQLLHARENSARQMQGLLADARGELADRGTLSTPGVEQGAENLAIENITEKVGRDQAAALRDITTSAINMSNDDVMNALQMATGMSRDQTSAILGAIGQGTQRQQALSQIALQALEQDQEWSKFLAEHGLDVQKVKAEIEQGEVQNVIALLQLYLQGGQIAAGGYY